MKAELLYRAQVHGRVPAQTVYGQGVVRLPENSYIHVAGFNKYTKLWYSLPTEVVAETIEEFTGFVHTKTKKQIFENDVLLEEIETDEGDVHKISIVTWIQEWAMFALLSHSERLEYEDGGVEVLGEDISSYLLFQEDIDVYAVNLGNRFGQDWGKYYM